MDVIERQAAIDAVLSIGHIAKLADGDAVIRMSAVNYVLRNLPSAEPVRMKGKWIEVYDADNLISGKCSVCGWEAHLYEDDVFGMPYCPNCGARLSEGEEDE